VNARSARDVLSDIDRVILINVCSDLVTAYPIIGVDGHRRIVPTHNKEVDHGNIQEKAKGLGKKRKTAEESGSEDGAPQ
jgi:hypothetical protein